MSIVIRLAPDSVSMTKVDFEALFKAVDCAVGSDITRPYLQQIAVYILDRQNPGKPDCHKTWQDFCLVASDGHRIHWAATSPIEDFFSLFSTRDNSAHLLNPEKVKAALKTLKKLDVFNVERLFLDCCSDKGDFPPLLWLCEHLRRPFDGPAAPFCADPKYLGHLTLFKTDSDVSLQIIPGPNPLDPIVARVGSNVSERHYAAVIMPVRP